MVIIMSIILGYQDDKNIYILGDKRACNVDGKVISEDSQKVFEVNEHLCFASAGVAVIETILSREISKMNKNDLYIEDISDLIKSFYKDATDKEIPSIYSIPTSLIIGGMNRNHENGIYSITVRQTKISEKYVPMILFPPADSDVKMCAEILGKNMQKYGSKFAGNTIKEVSDISIWVNDRYDLWIYDKDKNIGKYE